MPCPRGKYPGESKAPIFILHYHAIQISNPTLSTLIIIKVTILKIKVNKTTTTTTTITTTTTTTITPNYE